MLALSFQVLDHRFFGGLEREAFGIFITRISSVLLSESSFKIYSLSFFFVVDLESTGQQFEVNPLIEEIIFPVDATIDFVFMFSLTNVCSHIRDWEAELSIERVSNQSILFLFF